MIVDLPFLKRIADAMKDRINETENAYIQLEKELAAISTSDWDDAKRKEYEDRVRETKESVSHSIIKLKNYLSYLQTKITALENK